MTSSEGKRHVIPLRKATVPRVLNRDRDSSLRGRQSLFAMRRCRLMG